MVGSSAQYRYRQYHRTRIFLSANRKRISALLGGGKFGSVSLSSISSYQELSSDTRSEILSFEINSIVVSYADDDTITEIFMRLQEGVRLNPAERLNAERSKMRKAVIEILKHPFFAATRLKNIRFSYRYYAAQMLTLSKHPESTDVGYLSLKRTYDSFKNGFPSSAKDKTNQSLTLLKKILGTRSRVIGSKSDILIIHLIASQLLSAYSIHGFEEKIADFIINFISRVSKLSQYASEQNKDPYIRYAYFKNFAFLHIQDNRK